MVANILRERSAHIATRVGRRFQDDTRIGEVLGHAAHVAFDTIVEIKRAMRGLQYESADSVFNSKIEVAETMLAHLMSKLGISEVPPPPHTTRLATVRSAMRMARDLRMILGKIPTGTDARDYREARYNLAVYDLDQVSRQISEIMLDLSEDNAYQELQEPSFSRFDAVMADAKAGLADADEAFGGGQKHNAAWEKATFESKMNLLPKWKRNQEEFAQMSKGEAERLSQRLTGPNTEIATEQHSGVEELPIESIIGDPSPEMDVQSGPVEYEIKPAPIQPAHAVEEEHAREEPAREEPAREEPERIVVRKEDTTDPIVCVDAEDHHPGEDIGVLCPHGPAAAAVEEEPEREQEPEPEKKSLHYSGEALIREAVAAAMKQDARAESSHPALVDRLAERKIEMTAVRSVMHQLEQTERNRPFAEANMDGVARPLQGRYSFLAQRPTEAGRYSGGNYYYHTNALASAGHLQDLAMLPNSIMTAANKVAVAKTSLSSKAAQLAGKARFQSLAEENESEKEDPRLSVTVAGEKGFTEPDHPGGSPNNLTPSEIESVEEDEAEKKVEEREAGEREAHLERPGVGTDEHLRDGEGAGAYRTVTEEGGDVTSGVSWATSPERSMEPRLPYDLQLEKDAVYQASKTGMIMELNHPGWQDSVENAASVAVDAAIRAETYNGGDALMMVERAAVEGATKAAKEMEIKAENDGSQGPSEQAVAQRVENSAVRAAIMAANEVQSEHSHKAVFMRPAMVMPSAVAAMPSSMTISSSTPGAAQGMAAAMSGAYAYQMPAAAAVAAPVVAQPAAAAAMGAPMLATGGGVNFGGGSSFIPDSVQSVPGMVEGTMYVPE